MASEGCARTRPLARARHTRLPAVTPLVNAGAGGADRPAGTRPSNRPGAIIRRLATGLLQRAELRSRTEVQDGIQRVQRTTTLLVYARSKGSIVATPPRARRRLPVPIVAALVVLLLAEIGLRVASPKLGPLNAWNDWEVTRKVEAIDALAAKGGASVVFVGSSMVNAAADPVLYSELSGAKRPAFNAALNGAGTRLFDLWTMHVVVPRLHPKVVVVGLSSRELNDLGSSSEQAYQSVRGSPGGRSVAPDLSPTEWILRAGDQSYLVRYRQRLRSPSTLFDIPPGAGRNSVGRLGTLAALRIFTRPQYLTEDFHKNVVPRTLARFAVGGRALDALRHLVDELTAARIRVVLVKMPVTQDAIDAHPHGAEDYRRFEQILATFASQTQVIDADAWFDGTAEFADPFHLNSKGRERFTRQLDAETVPI